MDPLLCPNCGKDMKIIAFITNHQEVKKILKHIGEETERAPPLPAIIRYELEDSYDWGDFPPDEAYFCDAEWGLETSSQTAAISSALKGLNSFFNADQLPGID